MPMRRRYSSVCDDFPHGEEEEDEEEEEEGGGEGGRGGK